METMQRPTATSRPKRPAYNYEHFQPGVPASDFRMVARDAGPQPGYLAPDFELDDTDGETWWLGAMRDRPVVLVIGSGSCPLTEGSLPALREVYRDFSDRTDWFFLYVREAHPGEHLPFHSSDEQKRANARFFYQAEKLPWKVLVDDLEGTTHRAYGLLPNSVFVVDVDGRISFRGDFAHGPTLRSALEHLLAQDGGGVVPEGRDSRLHMLGATTFGWRAISRSGETARRDLSGAKPLAANLRVGSALRPVLDPVARRSKRLPGPVRLGLMAGAGILAAVGILAITRKKG